MAATIDVEKCDGCGTCIEICPVGAIKLASPVGAEPTHKEVAVIDENTCIECGVCVDECPGNAIRLS